MNKLFFFERPDEIQHETKEKEKNNAVPNISQSGFDSHTQRPIFFW